jgi:UPF0755 protein
MRLRPALVRRVLAVGCISIVGCRPDDRAVSQVEFAIPSGATFAQIIDTLAARELIRFPIAFKAIARLRHNDRGVRSGGYRVPSDIGWLPLLDVLVEGRVVTVPITIPEGFTLLQIAPRLAEVANVSLEEVENRLQDPNAAAEWGVPGPTLEGYLFPDTYRFAPGVSLDLAIQAMIDQYRRFWTGERRARAAALQFSERDVTTLASIIQGEALRTAEMPTISGVFHNRLDIGYLLQADPTVQYALGGRRSRLLFSDIESVAEHPYNTYTYPGLPPGPIGAPGEAALEAALDPAEVEYLYFVARPDGSHIFTPSLEAHNRARIVARREWDALERASRDGA